MMPPADADTQAIDQHILNRAEAIRNKGLMPLVRRREQDAAQHRACDSPSSDPLPPPLYNRHCKDCKDEELGEVPTLHNSEPGKAPEQSELLHSVGLCASCLATIAKNSLGE